MFKICFLGAGSTVFAKNVIGDCILTPELGDFEVALYDIDAARLEDSRLIVDNINKNYSGRAEIRAFTDRREALRNADFIVNAIQVGGYEPCTVTDFEVPKRFGLRQTIADTLGIGGIFRALRTIPVLEDFAEDIRAVAKPGALFINYTNPMAILTGYLIRVLGLNAVGLCHSVQACAKELLEKLGMEEYGNGKNRWKIAGINHQAWLLEITDLEGNDLYPEIKRRAETPDLEKAGNDLVRFEMMKRFGYYITESSEHTSEYLPYFIKQKYPELIEKFRIPLDEYPRRCIQQIEGWKKMREMLVSSDLKHEKSHEFASYIIDAIRNDRPYRIHGNVINGGLIPNLPHNACVEVPCLVDRNGVQPCFVGDLPEQCAALNRTNINVQLMTIEAARTRKKDAVYMAAYLDPHTSSELSLDEIKELCDALFEAHKGWLPEYR